ncbi:MAG: GNAT family N-acetyltransferase [Chloroflexi bacterium]|nr:MAG: GNAT family N-acetyltransferase [Chloroflexota bacterium]
MHKKIEALKEKYPKKFVTIDNVFRRIRRGDKIFISTGCGQPQYLVQALVDFVEANPTAFYDAEVYHMWTLGVAPYAEEKFKEYFRHNSFFVSDSTRDAVNKGMADYTPLFLSQIPALFHRKLVHFDVALIQTSLPDKSGYVSLGINADVTKAAIENTDVIIAQINANMPRVPGDGFVKIEDIDVIVPYDEPLLEYKVEVDDVVIQQIGRYVSHLIEDGDTLQVGYGSTPNAILSHLDNKKHLGIHTELLSDGIVELMKKGVVDNSNKTVNRGRTVATYCMGSKATYDFLDDNPAIEFRTVDYTNSPSLIARQDNMSAINSALEVDLTGQATAESIGRTFFRGIGGQVDFMRGAIWARNGKSILAIPSTARNGEISRIMPTLSEGAAVTFNRGDVHYVVTEFGIAYLHGKNIRERAMELISIAHPKFRPWLIEEAKKLNYIFKDQGFIRGKGGEYPQHLETYRTIPSGKELLLRPVKISDEPLLKDFFYSLSDESLHRRFMSMKKSIPHERLQELVVIDYTNDMVILAVNVEEEIEEVVGIGQYSIDEISHTADVAFAVRDEWQGKGIGTELMKYLTVLAKKRGLLGFTADVLADNWGMLRVFNKMGFQMEKHFDAGVYELKMTFKESSEKKH